MPVFQPRLAPVVSQFVVLQNWWYESDEESAIDSGERGPRILCSSRLFGNHGLFGRFLAVLDGVNSPGSRLSSKSLSLSNASPSEQ